MEEQRKELETKATNFANDVTRLRRINRNWDGVLTIITITFTLLISVLSTLEPIDERDRKIATGILGAVIVAIQAIGNAFPVKQKAGGYRLLQAQANNLILDLRHLENLEELKAIEERYFQLELEAAKMEN
jgi:hypothetical protein